jgi:hypothetical protein
MLTKMPNMTNAPAAPWVVNMAKINTDEQGDQGFNALADGHLGHLGHVPYPLADLERHKPYSMPPSVMATTDEECR